MARVVCERAGLLADIAAADRRIRQKLLTTTRRPARFSLDRSFVWKLMGTGPGCFSV